MPNSKLLVCHLTCTRCLQVTTTCYRSFTREKVQQTHNKSKHWLQPIGEKEWCCWQKLYNTCCPLFWEPNTIVTSLDCPTTSLDNETERLSLPAFLFQQLTSKLRFSLNKTHLWKSQGRMYKQHKFVATMKSLINSDRYANYGVLRLAIQCAVKRQNAWRERVYSERVKRHSQL